MIRLGKGMCSQFRFVTSNADDEELRAPPAAVEFTVVVLAHETVLGATDGNALRIGRIYSPIGEAGNASVTDPDAPSGKLRSALALLEGAGDRLLNMSETFAHGLSVAERLVCCNHSKNCGYALHEPMAGANCCGAPSLFWKNLNPVLEVQFEVE